jgi:polyhydroxyalkanoate synthesis regulator protein
VQRNQTEAMADVNEPVAIKRYGEGRLYHPGPARYVALGEPAIRVTGAQAPAVHDASSGDDVSRPVLQEIIIEKGRHG